LYVDAAVAPRETRGAMQFDEVLRTFSAFFEREGVRYAVAEGWR
jgi:hypothetical protein